MNKPEIVLALDVDNLKKARFFVKKTYPFIKIFKVGIGLFTLYGPRVVKFIQDLGAEVFLDLKFFDIPHTVEKAVRSATQLKVKMLTLHTQGGEEMLIRAKKISIQEAKLLKIKPPFLLGVTILTSQEASSFKVLELAKLAQRCDLDGIVCAVKDLKLIKEKIRDKNFIFVTPGIRIENLENDDQKRTATIEEAKRLGANYIVLGRPILEAVDLDLILDKIRSKLL